MKKQDGYWTGVWLVIAVEVRLQFCDGDKSVILTEEDFAKCETLWERLQDESSPYADGDECSPVATTELDPDEDMAGWVKALRKEWSLDDGYVYDCFSVAVPDCLVPWDYQEEYEVECARRELYSQPYDRETRRFLHDELDRVQRSLEKVRGY
jgi:hypothetical protein